MIAQETVDALKAVTMAKDVIAKFLPLKKVGSDMVCCCPFHNEKSPSFKIKLNEDFWKCFGCGKNGDSIEFIKLHKNLTHPEALKYLCDFYHITVVEDKPQAVRTYKRPAPVTVKPTLSPRVMKWFDTRGITTKTLTEFKITECSEWMPKANAVTDAICFNYFRDGELINIKYRAAEKDFKLSKDAELIFYNLDAIKGEKYAIVCEGEIDCLSISQTGLKNVVSVPNGASGGTQKLEYLNNCFEAFKDVECIILFTDNDAPGMALRDELARRFGYDRCLKVECPYDCKDANDVLLKYGANKIGELIKNATEFPIEGVFGMDELYEDIKNFYYNGYPKGVKVGISSFDEYIQFMPGQFTTVTGIPGSGKSEFVDYIMAQTAVNHQWNWGVCSFENQPSSLHATKLMEKYVGKSFAHRYNPYDRMNSVEFDDAVNFVGTFFHFININKIDVTLQGILDKAKELVLRKGINGLLIDPWNYIEHKSATGQTETQYVSECLTKIKAFAATHGIHIFIIAHPTKLQKVNNKYEVPTLYNISGSAHFFNKTDNGITVYRDFGTNKVDIHIQKVRYSWLGKVGLCSFTYNLDTRQYVPIDPNNKEPF